MRVKLSYTVDEEDVLKEAAKLLQLSSDDMGQIVGLFNGVQGELKGGVDATRLPNIQKSIEMIDEFRTALLNVDTRLGEVREIVTGYQEYQIDKQEAILAEHERAIEATPYTDVFGSD